MDTSRQHIRKCCWRIFLCAERWRSEHRSAWAYAAGERHPRTALGVSRDGNSIFLLVIDGRTPESVGAIEEEVALWMRYLGASDAITLDGGGSAAMAILDTVVRLENVPVHNSVPRTERAVATCIGFALPASNATEKAER